MSGGVRNVTILDSDFIDCYSGAVRLKSAKGRGG
jgi:hypothetical protein